VQKLETICGALRRNAAKVRQLIADLPGLKLRKSNDVDGELGVTVFVDMGTRQRRDKFIRALTAEGVVGAGPGGSVILPADKRIENKVTIHPSWPSFTTPQGKAIQYGAESCPHGRHPRPPRRRDHGPQLQRTGPARHRRRDPQGVHGDGRGLSSGVLTGVVSDSSPFGRG
jgi:hypothetical protein